MHALCWSINILYDINTIRYTKAQATIKGYKDEEQ